MTRPKFNLPIKFNFFYVQFTILFAIMHYFVMAYL